MCAPLLLLFVFCFPMCKQRRQRSLSSKVQDLNIPVVGPPSSSQKIFKCACAVLTHFIETIANFHVLQDISTSTSEFNKVNHRVL